jgi:hypothetical protein
VNPPPPRPEGLAVVGGGGGRLGALASLYFDGLEHLLRQRLGTLLLLAGLCYAGMLLGLEGGGFRSCSPPADDDAADDDDNGGVRRSIMKGLVRASRRLLAGNGTLALAFKADLQNFVNDYLAHVSAAR